MKLFKSPRALIHYSHAEIDVFDRPQGQFKVQTQGRLYTLNFDKSFMSKLGVTKAIKPRSALLFTDAALEKFTPHPVLACTFSSACSVSIGAVSSATWSGISAILCAKAMCYG